ncbi:MAG: hypothetical protein K5666_04955 [Bacilli bacterium]|nr:hypothetical protein [Bacilli bacterium]
MRFVDSLKEKFGKIKTVVTSSMEKYGEGNINLYDYYMYSLHSNGNNGEVVVITPDRIVWRVASNIGQTIVELQSLVYDYVNSDPQIYLNNTKKNLSSVTYSDLGVAPDNEEATFEDIVGSFEDILIHMNYTEEQGVSELLGFVVVNADSIYNNGTCEIHIPPVISIFQSKCIAEIKEQLERFNAESDFKCKVVVRNYGNNTQLTGDPQGFGEQEEAIRKM